MKREISYKRVDSIANRYMEESEQIKVHSAKKAELAEAAKGIGREYGDQLGNSKLVITDRYEVGVCEAKALQFDDAKFAKDHPEIYKQCSTIVVILDKKKLKKAVEQRKISAKVLNTYISFKTQERVVVRKKGVKDDSQEEGNVNLW